MSQDIILKLKAKASSIEEDIKKKREAFERSLAPEKAELSEVKASVRWVSEVSKAESPEESPKTQQTLELDKIAPEPKKTFTAEVIKAVDSIPGTINKREVTEVLTTQGVDLPPDAHIQISTILGRLEKRLRLTKTAEVGPHGSRSYEKTENWKKD